MITRSLFCGRSRADRNMFSNMHSGRYYVSERHRANSLVPSVALNATEDSVTTTTEILGEITRHGHGDACITLNVGGKEFHTLRSTVNSNSVLAELVGKAEMNAEIMKNGAVFIDRDPEHFGFVLKHLQNRIENRTTMNHKSLIKFTKSHMDIPSTNGKVLSELYFEATFYKIEELKEALCAKSWRANMYAFFRGKSAGNPIESASNFLVQIRTGLIAAGTVGGTMFVTLQDEYEWLLRKLGFWSNEKSPPEIQIEKK